MKGLEYRRDTMKCWSSSDGTGRKIEKKLKTVNFSSWKIKQKKVAIVDIGLNDKSSNS